MGNVTANIKRRAIVGNKKRVYVDITLAASYATNGDTFQAADIQAIFDQKAGAEDLTKCDFAQFEVSSGGHTFSLDRTNKKILAWNGTTQIANATNLSTFTVRAIFEFGDDPASTV